MTFEELPSMEEKCRECNGIGQLPWEYETTVGIKKKKKIVHSHKPCPNCKGRGRLLTPFGQAVIQLVTDWSPWAQEIDNLRDDIRDIDRYTPYDRQCD